MGSRARASITEKVYRDYLEHLLRGDLPHCRLIVQRLLQGGVPVETLYLHLLQRSLYEVGDLWAAGQMSVAGEHMTSAATEDVMRMVYPLVMEAPKTGRSAIISCTADEYHQIGGHMVADLMELAGWQIAFLGANTPLDSLLLLIEQLGPEVVGLSATMPRSMGRLLRAASAVQERFQDLRIIVGGQALRNQAGRDLPPDVRYIESVDQLHFL